MADGASPGSSSSCFSLTGGRVLTQDGLRSDVTVTVADGQIDHIGLPPRLPTWNVAGLLVLPGIVDLHGDAFERQMMPRPGVHFDTSLALHDTDRQLIANGITTAFHALTYSWEPGLRSNATGREFLAALEAERPGLACDARFHLRWEGFNLDVVDEVAGWLRTGKVDLLAFNDHTPEMIKKAAQPENLLKYAERGGLAIGEFRALLDRVAAREAAVPSAVEHLAAVARAAGVPMASHDDTSPDQRRWFRSLGCEISEFPKNEPTARVAREDGHDIIMGAPNVVRGGSHLSSASASEMVGAGLCTILASDYYYPAQLHAAFRLARDKVCPFETAWRLISANPARAARLDDRGVLEAGKRADLIVVDDSRADMPRVVATVVAGKPVFYGAGAGQRLGRIASDEQLAHAG